MSSSHRIRRFPPVWHTWAGAGTLARDLGFGKKTITTKAATRAIARTAISAVVDGSAISFGFDSRLPVQKACPRSRAFGGRTGGELPPSVSSSALQHLIPITLPNECMGTAVARSGSPSNRRRKAQISMRCGILLADSLVLSTASYMAVFGLFQAI